MYVFHSQCDSEAYAKRSSDYLPVYFQACKDASPTRSGVELFGVSFVLAPIGVCTGVSITLSHRYRPQMWAGWVLATIGIGTLIILDEETSLATVIGFEALIGIGLGILTSTVLFPILAPLDVAQHAHGIALYTFIRNFSQVSIDTSLTATLVLSSWT